MQTMQHQVVTSTESTPAIAADSQTNTQAVADLQATGASQPKPKPLKTYLITVVVRSESGGPPTVREINIEARSKTVAETLATALVLYLDAARTQSVTTEYESPLLGSGWVLKVVPTSHSKTPNRHVWTPREIGELLSTHGSNNNVYRL